MGGYPVTRYVAFLRAVNVGGRVVKMDRLRLVFESLGYTGVQTFIASGNVVFESSVKSAADLERALEAALLKAFGFPVATFIRSVSELASVAKHQPFRSAGGEKDATVYIAFIREEPDKPSTRRLMAFVSETDDFRVRGREVYWLRRGGFAGSKLPPLEKTLGMDATVRNSTTVRKMAAKFGQALP
jgi:uncharacterized protein (DUF1697 family)